MKKFKRFLALVAILSFALAQTIDAGPALYNITVAVTQTNTVVTPTAANGKVKTVRVLNDGANPIYVDFDRVAVAASTTATKIMGCEGRDFLIEDVPATTLGIIADTGNTSSARVAVHYMTGPKPSTIPLTHERVRYVANVGCTSTALVAKGADVASATALPVPSGVTFHVTGTTSVTSILTTGLAAGSRITIIFDGILTFTDGNNLKLAGNFVTTADDTITLTYDGTNFYEVSRSVN